MTLIYTQTTGRGAESGATSHQDDLTFTREREKKTRQCGQWSRRPNKRNTFTTHVTFGVIVNLNVTFTLYTNAYVRVR